MTIKGNEAAERQGMTSAERLQYDLSRAYARDRLRIMAEALTAERRAERKATVERIHKAAWDKIGRFSGEHSIRMPDLTALLDEEGAR